MTLASRSACGRSPQGTDADVAHALRAHYAFVEMALVSADAESRRRWLDQAPGTKYFGTGALFSDRLWVLAAGADGSTLQVIAPSDRDGVAMVDDRDGIGQRFTGSGTTVFETLRLAPRRSRPRKYSAGSTRADNP